MALSWWLTTIVARLGTAVAGPVPASPAEVLTLMAAVGALTLAVWLSASVVVAVLAELPGPLGRAGRWVRDRLTPQAARRLAGVLLGAGVTTGLLPTAACAGPAVMVAAPPAAVRAGGDQPLPAPGWIPTRPRTPRQGPPSTRTDPRAAAAAVIVRPGDTLWGIVRADLGPNATTGDVARTWPAWYAANHRTIGEDPDLILPGQRLVPPADRP